MTAPAAAPTDPTDPAVTARRQHWLAVLARASRDELAAAVAQVAPLPPHRALRAAEAGMVMLRGRAGGTGAEFNLGEATVVRCALQFDDGRLGVGYALGRDRRKAELIAQLDGVLQDRATQDKRIAQLVEPLARQQAAARDAASRAAAASRVEFFTLVRGQT